MSICSGRSVVAWPLAFRPAAMSVVLMLLSATVPAVGEGARLPPDLFAGEARGPYGTGTIEVVWTDEQRKRRVVAQLWYPTAADDDSPRAPYVLNHERYLFESDQGASSWNNWRAQLDWPDAVRDVRTNSVTAAPLARGGERFAVLLYSHGAGQPQFTATFQTEFLASHGYVVVAIAHAGVDGLPSVSAQVPAQPSAQQKQLSLREQFEWNWRHGPLATYVPDAVANLRLALGRLEAADGDAGSPLYRRLDLQRVGAFGFSWGGSISLQAALLEPRVKAVINEDGGPWGLLGDDGAVSRGLSCPVMIMTNHEDWGTEPSDASSVKATEQELKSAMQLHYWSLLRRSSAAAYWVRLANSKHLNFSDRPLFDPEQGAGQPEHIHPRLAHRIVNHYGLEFFDRHLRGRTDTPLLTGSERYRDAVLLRVERDE